MRDHFAGTEAEHCAEEFPARSCSRKRGAMTTAAYILAGSVAMLLAERWLEKLPRFTPQEPVEILPLLQPPSRTDIEAAFQAGDFIPQLEGSGSSSNPALRRELHSRIALSWACVRRMDENVEVIELEFANELRSFNRSDKLHRQEVRQFLSDVPGLQRAAKELEREARLPERSAEAEELRQTAAGLCAQAEALLAEAAAWEKEWQEDGHSIAEANKKARQFRRATRFYLIKLAFLSVLLRLDKLRVLPVLHIAKHWHRGLDDLLNRYQQIKEAAVVRATPYRAGAEIRARM
jgi:hypothetical protein